MTMAMIDLSSYNLSELKGLLLDIEKERKGRQFNEVNKAREQILAIAQNLGVSVEDLLGSTVKKPKPARLKRARHGTRILLTARKHGQGVGVNRGGWPKDWPAEKSLKIS